MKYKIINEGVCTRLSLVGEDIDKLLYLNGHQKSENPDYYFINTCSFLKSKQEESLKRIGEYNPEKTIVFGCLPSTNPDLINPELIRFHRNLDEIIDYFDLEKTDIELSTIAQRQLNWKQKVIKYLFNNNHIKYRIKDGVYHIKISEGCKGKCTYCSEKFTTKFKTRTIDEVMESFHKGLDKGYKLFALNSDDTSAFGENETFQQLLEKIISINEEFKVAIPEFNPQGLRSIRYLLESEKVLYITIPVQSGSQKILNKMKRPYNIETVMSEIKEINNSNLKINTHLMVGFPGETEEDFKKTYELIPYFNRIKVFSYSKRPGTEAAEMQNQVPEEIKQRRKKILQKKALLKPSLTDFVLNLNII